jgi:hypothetical protein
MSQAEGINLNGIRRILSLAEENRILKHQLMAMQRDVVFQVHPTGETSIASRIRTRKIKPPRLITGKSNNQT